MQNYFIRGNVEGIDITSANSNFIQKYFTVTYLFHSWSYARGGGAHSAKLQAQRGQWRLRAVCRYTRGWERCMPRRQWWASPVQV